MESMKKPAAMFPTEVGQNLSELGTFKEPGYLCLFHRTGIFKIQKDIKMFAASSPSEVSKEGRQLCRGIAPRQHIPDIKNSHSSVL